MNKKWLSFGHLFLWLVLAFLLPWQTKLILRPSLSNYWEIALFVAMPIALLLSLLFYLNNFRLLKSIKILAKSKLLVISSSLFLLSLLLTVFIASDPLLSISHYLWFSLFILTLSTFKYLRRDWQIYVLLSLLFSLLLQAGIGIWQFFYQESFASTLLGMSFHDFSQAGVSVIETASGRYLRAYGPLDHPNVFGGLMSLSAIVTAYLYLKFDQLIIRYFAIFSYPIFIIALLSSFSRAAVLAFLLGLIVLLAENRKKVFKALALLIISLSLLGLFSFQYQELIFSRFKTNNRLEQISLNERGTYNMQAWQVFQKKPIFGQGLANSTLVLYESDLNSGKELAVWNYQPAHNYWLLILAEGGLVLFLSLAFFYLFAYQKSRDYRLLGLFICFFILALFDHWLLSIPLASVLPLFWLVFI